MKRRHLGTKLEFGKKYVFPRFVGFIKEVENLDYFSYIALYIEDVFKSTECVSVSF